MSYDDAWVTTAPLGSVQASTIDDEIRKLRAQLKQRMEDLFIVDIAADPWVPKTAAVPGTKTVIIPFSEVISDLHARENDVNSDGYSVGFQGNGTTSGVYAVGISNLVGVGDTLTLVEYLVDKDSCSSLTAKVKKKPFAASAGAASDLDTTTISTTGIVLVGTPALTEVIAADRTYYIVLFGNGSAGNSFKIYGIRLTYTIP